MTSKKRCFIHVHVSENATTRNAMRTATRAARSTERASTSTRTPARLRNRTRIVSQASAAYDALIFDLDGVMYDAANGYLAHVRERQRVFLVERYGMTMEDATETRKRAFDAASQCFKGLKDMGFEIEQEDFTAFCRAGCEEFMTRDEALLDMLRDMPYRKVILTNTSETQGFKVLKTLGLAVAGDPFERVYGGLFCAPVCKPQREAFEKVIDDMGKNGKNVDPNRCVMFEDSFKNLKTAKDMGMTTVFVRTVGGIDPVPSDEELDAYCDAVVDRMDRAQLFAQLPDLFTCE